MYFFKPQMNLAALGFYDCEVGPDIPLHCPGLPGSTRETGCHLRIYPRAAALDAVVGWAGLARDSSLGVVDDVSLVSINNVDISNSIKEVHETYFYQKWS